MESHNDKTPFIASTLRHRAEEHMKSPSDMKQPVLAEPETERLLNELQIHQIELEMQNTELRQARDEMETILTKFTDLYDFAPIGYITLDSSRAISAVNLAGASIIGGVRSRLIGRSFGQFISVTDRQTFTHFLDTVLISPVKTSCEVTLLNKGKPPVIMQIQAMATASGQEFRLALIDITERKFTEAALSGKRLELENINAFLEERITQNVEALRDKDQMLILQDRRAIMGEMINNIAHQWRQPLNTLALLTQQLPLFYDTPEFGHTFYKENTERSMSLIQQMSRTIDDFRTFFRSDKEKISFDVKHIVKQALTLLEMSFQEQQITIDFQVEGTPMISGYPNEYSQVLINILMNSRDALVEHKGTDARISLKLFIEGDHVVLTIADNAGGIADEIIGKIFDPYFTTKDLEKGTGIGLFMSKTIIEKNMGGRLTAHNNQDGAELRIVV